MLPNRIAVYATAIAALAAALLPVIANLDTSSTVGLVGGVASFAGVTAVWLRGWASYEERTDLEGFATEGLPSTPDTRPAVPDQGDADAT